MDVAADVIAIIGRTMPPDHAPVQLSDRLEDLGFHSINAVELIFDLEEKFDIQIPYNANSQNMEFDTVGDVVTAVQGLVGSKP